jgi:hypothetical protein
MKPKKKSEGPDYRCFIFPDFDEREQRYKTRVVIETTTLFSNFRYELKVDEHVEGKTLKYTVRGLTTPKLSLPHPGAARFTRLYDDLKGTFEMIVEGLDGKTAWSKVKITPRKIEVLETSHNTLAQFAAEPPTSPLD